MKKKLLLTFLVVMCVMLLAVSASAAAPAPQKPDIGVDFGTVTTIPDFTPPSEKFVNTDERILFTYGEGEYVTYPTYYVTKDSYTFDFDFSKLNAAIEDTGVSFDKTSIVMLEVPDGITALSNSYFSGKVNFAKCLSIQIPGSVTSYGSTTFIKNSIVRIVEFLDGTEPVTMGNQMFSSNSTGGDWGTTNIEYVKFPNNLVSIGQNTFGKSYQSKTIILGENLESIGAGFLNESTPSSKDTFIYVSSKFFTESAISKNLFGGRINGKDTTSLMLTIFYVGTEDEARDFVDAGKAIQSGYVFDNVKFVSASNYDYDTDRPKGTMQCTYVYDYNACDAFYYGNHTEKDTANGSACYLAECKNCGVKSVDISSATTHNYEEVCAYTNYFANGAITKTCQNANCVHSAAKTPITDNETLKPLFKELKYSTKEEGAAFGIYVEYQIDQDAIALYKELSGKSVSYGVMAIKTSNITGNGPLNVDGLTDANYVVAAEVTNDKLACAQLIITGNWEANADVEITMLGYVTDGEELHYMGSQTVEGEAVATTGAVAGAFNAVSYENIIK